MALGACGRKSDAEATAKEALAKALDKELTATVSDAGLTPAQGADAATEAAKPVELVDLNLSSAGPKWKGLTLKAPSDAEISKVSEGRVDVRNRTGTFRSRFDIELLAVNGYFNLKGERRGVESIHKSTEEFVKKKNLPTSTLEFIKDEPDLLEWKSVTGSIESHYFVMLLKNGNTSIKCSSNAFASSDPQRTQEHAGRL